MFRRIRQWWLKKLLNPGDILSAPVENGYFRAAEFKKWGRDINGRKYAVVKLIDGIIEAWYPNEFEVIFHA